MLVAAADVSGHHGVGALLEPLDPAMVRKYCQRAHLT
jgi:hypothetical protein